MTIRLLYVDRSVHQAWPVARELELGRLCQESVTVAEVTMMGATCFGLVEEVDALRDAVRPGIQGCGDAVRPGMQGCRKSPAVKEVHWRRYSPNNTGDQGGRPARSLRSSESAVTDEGKADERCERRFLWEGQLSSRSPVDRRPWQVDWTALPRHRFGGHWRWTRAVCIPGRNPVKFLHSPSSPKVGPKLGEQCRTQVPTSAGSGNLQPTLDEEPCAPSGARPACCPPLQLAVLRSLGERRDQVPGVPPAILGDHAYHQVPLFPNCVVPAASIPAVACSSMPHCPGVLLQQLGRLPCNAHDGYAYHCI